MKRAFLVLAAGASVILAAGCFSSDKSNQTGDAGFTPEGGVDFDSGADGGEDASVTPDAASHDAATPMDARPDVEAEAGPMPQASLTASTGGSSMSNFGPEQIGMSSASATVVVGNAGNGPTGALAVMLAGPNSAEFVIDSDGCSGKTLAPSTTCKVSVHFAPTMAGAATAALDLSATPGGHASITLSGQGVTPGSLAITPAMKDFGSFTTGASSPTQTFTVSNSGGSATPAVTVAVNGANAGDFAISMNACSGPIAAGGSCTLDVAFAPSAAGTRTASLAATAGAFTATASLSGTGLAPAAFSLTPASWAFTSVTVGSTSAPQTFTLTNTGGDTSGVPQLAITGANAADFSLSPSPCATALAGGASCMFTVSFTPSVAAAETATLGATATSTAPASAGLSGTGLSPAALAIAPQGGFTGSFGPVELTHSSSASFTLQNNGQSATGAAPTITSSNGDFQVNAGGCTASLGAGATCPFSVVFAPSSTGSESAVITASASGAGTATYTLSGTGAVPVLAVTPPSGWTGFGTVDVGSSTSATFTVTNTGQVGTDAAPTLTSSDTTEFSIGSGSTPCTATLAPGGTCNFLLTFAPTSVVSNAQTTLTASVTPGTSVPYTASGSASVSTLQVSGTPFGYVTLGKSATLTYSVTNSGPWPVNGAVTVSSTSSDFVPSASCGPLAVNQSCNFNVTFTPSTTSPEMATITASAPPNNAGTYTATGQGAVGALGAISAWNAPATVQGSTSSTTYTIANNGYGATNPLSISGVTAGTGIFNLQADACSGQSLAPGGKCTFQVVFAPTTSNSSPGTSQSATVTVTDSASDKVSALVSGVPLYNGVYLVISPATASYGNVTTGQSPSLPFTMTNYGSQAAPPFSSIRVVSGTNETPSTILYDVGNATTADCPTNNSNNSPPVPGLASLASCHFSQPFSYGQSMLGAFSFTIYPTAYNYTSLGGPGATLSGTGL